MEKSRKYEKFCAAYLIYVYIKSVFAFARIFTLGVGIYILLYKYEECLITVSSLYNSVYNKKPFVSRNVIYNFEFKIQSVFKRSVKICIFWTPYLLCFKISFSWFFTYIYII